MKSIKFNPILTAILFFIFATVCLAGILLILSNGKMPELQIETDKFTVNIPINSNLYIWFGILITLITIVIYFLAKKRLEKIQGIEAFYRIISESIGNSLWIFDIKTNFVTFITDSKINENINKRKEINNKFTVEIADFMPPESYHIFIDKCEREVEICKNARLNGEKSNVTAVRSGVSTVFEIQLYNAENLLVWSEVAITVLMDSKETFTKILGTTRSIDERKKMELLLAENERKYRLIVDNTKDVICVMDTPASKFIYIGGACLETFGFDRNEYLKIPVSETMPEKYYQQLSNFLEIETTKFLSGQVNSIKFAFELQQYHKNGSLIWVEASAKMVKDEEGNLAEIIAVIREIEDRKAFEFSIIEAEKKMRLIGNNIQDSVWTMDFVDFRYDYLTPSAINITGRTVAEVLASQKTIFDIINAEYSEKIKTKLKNEIQHFLNKEKENIRMTFEAQIKHKNGYYVWIESTLAEMIDEKGNLIGIVGSTRRIDERKEMYSKIMEQQKELKLLNSTKDKFFSIISHDLRNPFAALLNMSELLAASYEGINYKALGECVNVIQKSAKYVYALLENLLKWSRSSMGTISYYPQKNDLIKLILETVIILKPQADAKNIAIEININDTKFAFFDSNMIETVIRNLITNAMKFSPDNSVISIKVEDYKEDNDYYIVSITDSGVGIPKNKIDRLFKVGEKNISTKGTKNELGTGLGLILCKEFIDKHNCKIFIESEEGFGSTFYFTLRKTGIENQ